MKKLTLIGCCAVSLCSADDILKLPQKVPWQCPTVSEPCDTIDYRLLFVNLVLDKFLAINERFNENNDLLIDP